MEISRPAVSYTVEIFGADYSDFHARKAEEAEDIGWISCVYKVAREYPARHLLRKSNRHRPWNKK